MPGSGTVCKKCRSGLAAEKDSWCLLCSCASALSEAAKHRFSSLAHRSLAEEITLQTSRQVQGLIQIDRQVHSERTSLSDRLTNAKNKLAEVTNQVEHSAQPKSASARPGAAGGGGDRPVKAEAAEKETVDKAPRSEADFGSESFEEETEEEEEAGEEAPAGEVEEDRRGSTGGSSPVSFEASTPSEPAIQEEEKERSQSRPRTQRRSTTSTEFPWAIQPGSEFSQVF